MKSLPREFDATGLKSSLTFSSGENAGQCGIHGHLYTNYVYSTSIMPRTLLHKVNSMDVLEVYIVAGWDLQTYCPGIVGASIDTNIVALDS